MLVYSHDHQSHLPDEQGWSIECSRVWHLLQKEYQLLKEDESNWTWKRKSHLWNNIIMIVLMIIISTYQMFMGDALGATGFGSCREGVSVAEWRYVPPKWRGMYCSLWNDIIMPALDDHESHLSDVQGLAAAVNRNISCCRKMSPLSSLQVWSVWLEWDLDRHSSTTSKLLLHCGAWSNDPCTVFRIFQNKICPSHVKRWCIGYSVWQLQWKNISCWSRR